jgi:hypothetical protein
LFLRPTRRDKPADVYETHDARLWLQRSRQALRQSCSVDDPPQYPSLTFYDMFGEVNVSSMGAFLWA